ncbi:MAG: hypothetical protein Q4C30_09480 [Bacteroidia bacterium]|nr:hypothetical protein [Bacteroidia bacterium]
MKVTKENYWQNHTQIRQDITSANYLPNIFTDNAWQLLDSEAEPSVDWEDWDDDDFSKQREVISQLIAEINKFYDEQGASDHPRSTKGAPKEHPKNTPEEKPKEEPKKTAPKKEEPKGEKPKEKPAPTQGKAVESLTPEVDIIQRYIRIHGKSRDSAVSYARSLLKRLQTMISTRIIRKTSKYAHEMLTIQEQLLRVLNVKNLDRVEIENIKHYEEIAATEYVSSVTTWIKTFISRFEHRRPEVARTRKFLAKAPNVPELQDAKHALDDYINNRTERVQLTEQQLNGLRGII